MREGEKEMSLGHCVQINSCICMALDGGCDRMGWDETGTKRDPCRASIPI